MNTRMVVIIIFVALLAATGTGLLGTWYALDLEREAYKTRRAEVQEELAGRTIEEWNEHVPGVQDFIRDTETEVNKVKADITQAEADLAELKNELEAQRNERNSQLQRWGEQQAMVDDQWGVSSSAAKTLESNPLVPAQQVSRGDDLADVSTSPAGLPRVDWGPLWNVDQSGGLLQFWKRKRQEIVEEEQLIDGLRQDFLRENEALKSDIDARKAELEAARNRFKNTQKDNIDQMAEWQAKLERIQARLEHEKEKRRRELEIKEADGHILTVAGLVRDQPTNFCVVDIGWTDGVRKGMQFDVFRDTRLGKRIIKGKIKVTKVNAKTSECLILPPQEKMPYCPQTGWEAPEPDMLYSVYGATGDGYDEVQELVRPTEASPITPDDSNVEVVVAEADVLDPIVEGDKISNPYFNVRRRPEGIPDVAWEMKRLNMIMRGEISPDAIPGERLTFVLGGEPLEKSRREVRMFIEENGGVLQESLTLNTNYYVVGTGPEAKKMLAEAQELGVRVIREDELYSMFGEGSVER